MREWSTKKQARRGPEHSQWKGGESVDKYGYFKLNINLIDLEYQSMCDSSGWVLEHRYLLAKKPGRPLTKQEIVHHKNHNHTDNSLDNLELTTRGEHMRSHKSWKIMRPEHVK